MRSELLTAEPETAGGDRGDEWSGAPQDGPWEQCFDLGPGRSTTVGDRGSRHLYWSLAETLRPLVRDLRALARRPLRALVLGCDEGYLAHRLLEFGAGSVLAADSRPESIERARWIRDRRAIDPDRLELRTCADPTALGLGQRRYDIAIADGRHERLGSMPGALEFVAACADACTLIAPDRLLAARALTSAGFGRPTLLEPPADGERRLIAFELNLMLARPAETGADPSRADPEDGIEGEPA